ncbi:MAG: ArnT family glycosyltransferase [Polyangiaceae bacterium]
MTPRPRLGVHQSIVLATALVVRLAVAAWGASRFPPAADGFYYDTLARRLAEGHGYTWLWPDGAVTNVAHYPVGYPALLAAAYLIFERPLAAMVVNALFGGAMALGVYRLVREERGSRAAILSALLVALHPALVPYTAAVMTEGIAAALLVIAVAVARGEYRRAWFGWALAGIALGVATLVRPQCLLFAPLLGLLAPANASAWRDRLGSAVVVTAVALAVCAPWTARNCVAMHKCALVSVNGGWNLLIGTQTTQGSWQPVDVPEACRTVWDEAAKDDCFGQAARAAIVGAPLAWLARAPAKVAVTFDYFGAAPWYLHESNPSAFGDRAKVDLGVVETVVSNLVLLVALAAVAMTEAPHRRVRIGIAVAGAVLAALLVHASIAYLALALAILALGPRWLARAPLLVPWTAVVILVTAATHAVFFGAGRYGLVAVPFVTALPFLVWLPALREAVEGARPA